jgi:hypothetical protein
MGQGRLGLLAWSELRPTAAKSVTTKFMLTARCVLQFRSRKITICRSLQKRKQYVNSDLGLASRQVWDAGGRVQRLAGVRDRKDNELSESARNCSE